MTTYNQSETLTSLKRAEFLSSLPRIEQEIREVKAILRDPGAGSRWREYGRLKSLKYEATINYVLRAHLRGKQHLKDPDLNKSYVENVLSEIL